MTTSARKSRRASAASAVSHPERTVAARLATILRPASTKSGGRIQVIDSDGQLIDLPRSLAEVMAHAASLIANGQNVSVLAEDDMLTTQAAADRLNVSRQYLVRLVDNGDLPSVKVGTHRRLRASDVAVYKAARDSRRDASLDRLAALSEEFEGYSLGSKM